MSAAPTVAPGAPDPAPSYPTVKLAGGRLAILTIKAVGTATLATLTGVDWSQMTGQQRFMAVLAITVNAATAIEAFFDKTMSRLAEGQAIRKGAASGNTTPPIPTTPP